MENEELIIDGEMMDNIDKFNEYYSKSMEIVKLYDRFVSLLLIKNKNNINNGTIKLLLNEIKNEINEEYEMYSLLVDEDVTSFINKIHLMSDEKLGLVNVRVNSQLAIVYDKLLGYTVLNDGMFPTLDENLNFSLIDLISSKIVIDIYKLLDNKLSLLSVNDDKSREYVEKIININKQYVIYKLCLHEVSERLAIDYCYDISKMPSISIDEIERNYFETYGTVIDLKRNINSKVFRYIITKINEFRNIAMNTDDYESIYDNLLYVTQIEVLITYLTKSQLEFILAYCSRIKSDNKMVLDNVKRLVRSQINGI